MSPVGKGKLVTAGLGLLISVGSIATLTAIVSPGDLMRAFYAFNPVYVIPFIFIVVLMVVSFAYRWRLLLQKTIPLSLATKAMLINLGANMVLPARGGDLLRIHYSTAQAELPIAIVLGAFVTEKAADLLAICLIGALGGMLLGLEETRHRTLIAAASGAFILLSASMVVVRKRNGFVRRICLWPFVKLRREIFFEQHVSPLIGSFGDSLELRSFARTMAVTLFLWLGIYAAGYLCIARLVGVPLSYGEALVVLWVSGLGLMIPAAPSGLGVYHATVVSTFYFLGRPTAQGLVLATALHISFFVALVVPMGLIYGKWLFHRGRSR